MSTFITVNPLQGDSLPITDLSWFNPAQITFILCEDVNLIMVTTGGFVLYAVFDNATDCQSYATTLITTIG